MATAILYGTGRLPTHWLSKMPKSIAALGLMQRTNPHVVAASVVLRFCMEAMKLPATVLRVSRV